MDGSFLCRYCLVPLVVSADVFPHLSRWYDAGQSYSRIARLYDGYSSDNSRIARYAARPQATALACCRDGSTTRLRNGVAPIRQYGRWLRDNYADLEQKEVWQGFVVLAIFFLVYAIYSLDAGELIYEYAMEVINIVLICYLLWRVETLSDLSLPINDAEDLNVSDKRERGISPGEKYSLSKNIGSLLQQHCIDQQLYLQHDLTLLQLAKAIGTNRFYLSQYFSNQGTTYNAYINDLRINHFVSLYREKRSSSAQQLAQESGYRSYRTFSEAFKRKMGHTVSAWIKAQNEG